MSACAVSRIDGLLGSPSTSTIGNPVASSGSCNNEVHDVWGPRDLSYRVTLVHLPEIWPGKRTRYLVYAFLLDALVISRPGTKPGIWENGKTISEGFAR